MESYSVASEKMMTYAEYDDDVTAQQARKKEASHTPVPVPKITI